MIFHRDGDQPRSHPHQGGERPAGADSVFALASLSGGLVASGLYDNTVRVWEVGSGRLVRTLAGHAGSIRALASLPGGLVASGSFDNTVAVWRVANAVGQ